MDSGSSSSASIPPSCLRDASFSSYLNSTEEEYIRTLVRTSQTLEYHQDDEIDVFSADKYFKGDIDEESKIATAKYQQQVMENQTHNAMTNLSKIKLQPRTPSIHSESSCHSQSALLAPVLRNPTRNDTDKRVKKPSFLSFRCCDKKSVDVDDDNVEFIKQGNNNNNNNREIPRTIKSTFDTAEITRLNKLRLIDDPFSFPGSDPGSKRFSLVPWEAINTAGLLGAEKSCSVNDAESDSSSDLFEIESLSCTENPRNGYAPSEVSVDWSVVTASAADFSEHGSTMSSVTCPRTSTRSKPSAKMVMNNKGLLSGCTNQKAVMVANTDVYRSSDKKISSGESQRMHKFLDSYASVTTRFHAEAQLPGHGPCLSKKPSGYYNVLYN